jgi:hypothetical protein
MKTSGTARKEERFIARKSKGVHQRLLQGMKQRHLHTRQAANSKLNNIALLLERQECQIMGVIQIMGA